MFKRRVRTILKYSIFHTSKNAFNLPIHSRTCAHIQHALQQCRAELEKLYGAQCVGLSGQNDI
jgi:hypothetical protein